jgi:hypothetical protein
MALQKLRDSIVTTGTAELAADETSPRPRLSVVRPDGIDLDAALQELAEIIEAEGGILIP